MKHKTKITVVNQLMQLVKDSPTMKRSKSSSYDYKNSIITKEEFENWMQYVCAVLEILTPYIPENYYIETISKIKYIKQKELNSNIATQYASKCVDISEELLFLANNLL